MSVKSMMAFVAVVACIIFLSGCVQRTQESVCLCQSSEQETAIRAYDLPKACFWTATSQGYDGEGEWAMRSDTGEVYRPMASSVKKRKSASRKSSKTTEVSKKADESVVAREACIDINTADVAGLMRLPGVGKTRAEAIVVAREKRAFSSPKSVTRVKGIGQKAYRKMADSICPF